MAIACPSCGRPMRISEPPVPPVPSAPHLIQSTASNDRRDWNRVFGIIVLLLFFVVCIWLTGRFFDNNYFPFYICFTVLVASIVLAFTRTWRVWMFSYIGIVASAKQAVVLAAAVFSMLIALTLLIRDVSVRNAGDAVLTTIIMRASAARLVGLRLNAPPTAVYGHDDGSAPLPNLGNNVYQVSGWVEWKNALGNAVRKEYVAKVRWQANDSNVFDEKSYSLVDLSIVDR